MRRMVRCVVVSADVHFLHNGVLVHVCWSVAVGARLACLAHDVCCCGLCVMVFGGGLRVRLDPHFLSEVLPTLQFHVPASMLACDDGLFFLRHGGADIDKGRDLLHSGIESASHRHS